MNHISCADMYDWCEERLEIQSIADDILAKFVPPHVNIFYCFGGIMLTSFIFQGGSGLSLTIYYQWTIHWHISYFFKMEIFSGHLLTKVAHFRCYFYVVINSKPSLYYGISLVILGNNSLQ